MRRTVENIKGEQIEFANTNFEFRDLEFGRDPRPIAGKDAFKSNIKSSDDLPKYKGELTRCH